MTTSPRNAALIRAVPVLLGIALATGPVWSHPEDSKAARVSADLPVSQSLFPQGDGAEIANAQCLICHSAGMVLRQPALTQDQWTREINKMRNSFGAPLPADQVKPLARYLYGINGKRASGGS
jgi:cytochrome c5